MSSHRQGTPTRHGRRPIRSSLTGPALSNPQSRHARFERDARAAVEYLQRELPAELEGVQIGFQTVPLHPQLGGAPGESTMPMLYSIDRSQRSIIMYRMPIQRSQTLHQHDDEHRRMFTERCVYLAVCEYLGRNPWDLMPDRFGHH